MWSSGLCSWHDPKCCCLHQSLTTSCSTCLLSGAERADRTPNSGCALSYRGGLPSLLLLLPYRYPAPKPPVHQARLAASLRQTRGHAKAAFLRTAEEGAERWEGGGVRPPRPRCRCPRSGAAVPARRCRPARLSKLRRGGPLQAALPPPAPRTRLPASPGGTQQGVLPPARHFS